MAVEDGEIPAHGGADGADNFGGKAQALGERSAVAVGAAVGEMRDTAWFDAGSRCAPWISTASNPAALARQGGLVPTRPTRRAKSSASIDGDGVVGLERARNDAR